MLKTQEIHWNKYQIDVEDVMTASALSLKIFRKIYLDEEAFQIVIPNRNQDNFIRRGYYGGHVDVYKPYGKNLFYYDVNSLYPYIMKTFSMPSGSPVWKNHLSGLDLSDLYGFIEAYIVCPDSIDRPFLPYKDKKGTLVFPTGKFTGIYFSEELKHALTLGYEIIPLRGYLFEQRPSPFHGFISDLYTSRLEAKKNGDEAMTYIYKTLMNSLYGRFGINPESSVTEICKEDRYQSLFRQEKFETASKINEEYFMVKYFVNYRDDDDWKAPKMSAVHLAAAITAYARIHMYPMISRSDCLYTDTDSVVLGRPLSDNFISQTELGLFKLEHQVKEGFFLAPKTYMLRFEDGHTIVKHKGQGKVTSEWFESLYADPSHVMESTIKDPFRKDWNNLTILRKEISLRLGLPKSSKRCNVYDSNNVWVNTRPKNIVDIGSEDSNLILTYEMNKERGPRPKAEGPVRAETLVEGSYGPEVAGSERPTSSGPKTDSPETSPTLYTTKPKTIRKFHKVMKDQGRRPKEMKDQDGRSPAKKSFDLGSPSLGPNDSPARPKPDE